MTVITEPKFLQEIYEYVETRPDIVKDIFKKLQEISSLTVEEGRYIYIPKNVKLLRLLHDDFNPDMSEYLEFDYLTVKKPLGDSFRALEDDGQWYWYVSWSLPYEFVEENRDKDLKSILGMSVEDTIREMKRKIEEEMKKEKAKKIILKNESLLPDKELKTKLIDLVYVNTINFNKDEFIEKVKKYNFRKLYQKDGSKLTKKLRKLLLKTSDLPEKRINELLADFVKKYYIKDEKVYFAKWIDKEEVAVGIWEKKETCLARDRQNEKAGDVFRYSKRFRAIGLFDSEGQRIGRAIVHFEGNRVITVTNWYFLKEESPSIFVKALVELLNIEDYTFEYVSDRAKHLPIYANDGYYIVKANSKRKRERKHKNTDKKYICPFCKELKKINISKGHFQGYEISSYTIVVYCDDCEDVARNYYVKNYDDDAVEELD